MATPNKTQVRQCGGHIRRARRYQREGHFETPGFRRRLRDPRRAEIWSLFLPQALSFVRTGKLNFVCGRKISAHATGALHTYPKLVTIVKNNQEILVVPNFGLPVVLS